MRIDGRWAAGAPAAAPKAGTAAGGRPAFRVATERPGEAGQTRAAAPLATLDAILALQEEDDPRERRRRSARRGQDLLDALDGLKAALLSGTVPLAEIGRISARLKASSVASGDPVLDGIVSAIELRAEVELAKLGIV